MKYFLFLAVLSGLHLTGTAQTWNWAQSLGNIKSDKVTCIKTDAEGYVYIAGYFSTSISIGTNSVPLSYVGSSTSKEIFLARLDSTGYCYWARSGGQYFDDRILGMDVDDSGNTVITGTFWEGSGIVISGLNITGSAFGYADQCFIAKHDKNGNILWGNFVCGNGGDDQGLDVATDAQGNSYVVGFMTGDWLYCGGPTVMAASPSAGYEEHSYWLAKINASGVFQWAKTFGNLPWDTAHFKYIERDIAVCVDDIGGVYITGGYDHDRKFETDSLHSLGGYDIFVMKYDTSGNYQWVTGGGSRKDDWSNGICADKHGFIYITGEHRDSLIVDTILIKNFDKRDAFVIKLDASTGKPVWGKRAGSDEGSERGNDIVADDYCNVYVTGDIYGGAKFGSDITVDTGNGVQAFLARMNPAGDWIWAITGGSADDEDRGNAIAKGKAKQVYVAGFFRSPATYGPTSLSSVGSSDGFFAMVQDSLFSTLSTYTVTQPNDTTICPGNAVTVSIPPHGTLTFNPATDVVASATGDQLTFAPSATTTYSIIASSTDICPAFDTSTFEIAVHLNPLNLVQPSDTLFCKGGFLTMPVPDHDLLTFDPATGVLPDTDSSHLTFTPQVNTTYTVTVYDHDGLCPAYDTASFTVTVPPDPVAEFSVDPQIALTTDPVFHLINQSTGALGYSWYYNGSLFSTMTDEVQQFTDTGTYCFTLIAETDMGCRDTVIHCGQIVRPHNVSFPTAFTPNGDGRNETFLPFLYNLDVSEIGSYDLLIVNRWGEVIFRTSDPKNGWTGIDASGELIEIGTYNYLCQIELTNGEKIPLQGDVLLIH